MRRARHRHPSAWLSGIAGILLALQCTLNTRVFGRVHDYVELDPDLLYGYGDAYDDSADLPGRRLQLEDPDNPSALHSRRSSNHTQLESLEALFDVLDAELEPSKVDPLGIPLLQQQPNDATAEDVLKHVTFNIESILSKAGTSLSEVWHVLAGHVQQAGLISGTSSTQDNDSNSRGSNNINNSNNTKDSTSTSKHTSSSGHARSTGPASSSSSAGADWIRDTVTAAVKDVMQPGQKLSPQSTPQMIAHVILSVVAAADQHAIDMNTGTSAANANTNTSSNAYAIPTTASSSSISNGTEAERAQSETHSEHVPDKEGSHTEAAGHKGRRLQQGAPGTNTGRIASAWRLVFGNFLDLINGGGKYWATVLANIAAFLLNNNLIRELSFYPEAWINDFVDTNQVPVPASNAAVLALLVAVIQGWCTLQTVGSSAQVLGSVTAPSLVITFQPATCPIRQDERTGAQRIIWAEWVFNAPFISGTSYTAGFCRYEYYLGTDSTYSVGGGNAGFTVRRSTRGFQILPVINQINLIARFAPYIFPQSPYGQSVNLTEGTLLTSSTNYGLGEGGTVGPIGAAGAGGAGAAAAAAGGAGGTVTARQNGGPARIGPTSTGAPSTGSLRSSIDTSGGSNTIGNTDTGMLSDAGLQDLFAHDGSLLDPSVKSWSLSPPKPAGNQGKPGLGGSYAAPGLAQVTGAAQQAMLPNAHSKLQGSTVPETAFGATSTQRQGDDSSSDGRVSYTDLLQQIVAQQHS